MHELTQKQEACKYDGIAHVLQGLSNSKLARPGKFHTADGLGCAVRCSCKVGLCVVSGTLHALIGCK